MDPCTITTNGVPPTITEGKEYKAVPYKKKGMISNPCQPEDATHFRLNNDNGKSIKIKSKHVTDVEK